MKLLFLLLIISTLVSCSIKKNFIRQDLDIVNKYPQKKVIIDVITLDSNCLSVIKTKQIVCMNKNSTFFIEYFNNDYIIVKEVATDSKYKNTSTTNFVPIAAKSYIFQSTFPYHVFYYNGYESTLSLEISYFKHFKRKLILYTIDKRQLNFIKLKFTN